MNKDSDDDLDGYEYFHPVHVLGFWLHDLLDRVLKPRFLDPPLNGAALTHEADEAKYGPIDTTEDWEPWGERHAMALKGSEHALDAAMGVNRWLRYGLGERAGRLETDLRANLPSVVRFLERTKDAEQFRKEHRLFLDIVGPVHDSHRELCAAAINPDDGALEEWFKIIEAMRSKLSEFLNCHKFLYEIVFRKPRGRIGDLLYRYMVAISDFENLLPVVESQIRRGYRGDVEYERAVELLRLSARARWSFEEVLTNNKLPPGSYPENVHEILRSEATYFLRKLELTVSQRPKADQPRVMWELGIAHSPADRPSWDKTLRELRFGEVLCKRFKTAAPNQEKVLQAFQEEHWPPRIDDPLEPGKLHETVRQLNKATKVIKFRSDGHGEGVCWALADPPK